MGVLLQRVVNPVVVVIGPTSCGKTSRSDALAQKLKGIFHEMSDGIRAKVAQLNEQPNVAELMGKGVLIDDPFVNGIFSETFSLNPDANWVFCGSGRTLVQAKHIVSQMRDVGRFEDLHVIELHRSFEECDTLRAERWKKHHRPDDDPEVFVERWLQYMHHINQVSPFFQRALGRNHHHLKMTQTIANDIESMEGFLNTPKPQISENAKPVTAEPVRLTRVRHKELTLAERHSGTRDSHG